MAIWPSLAPRAAAARACKWGGLAALLQAVRGTAGNIATFMTVGKPLDDAIAHFVGASLLPLLLVVAGIRLWRHDSWPVCMQAAIG